MSKVKFELDKAGVRELLQSPEMGAIVKQYADQVRGKAGTGYESETFTGFDRVHAQVYPATLKARKDNYENNTLLKSI